MSKPLYLLVFMLSVAALAGCSTAPVALHDAEVPQAAVATIILPEQLEVATINGLEIEGASGMLTRGDKTLEVAPGRYELVVFYRELWEGADQHDVLRSDPALFIVDAAPAGRYRLDYERPANLAQARLLAADFSGWVENLATGERTASVDSGLQFRRGLVPAVTFDDTLVPSADVAGGGQSVAPLPRAGAPATAESPIAPAPVTGAPGAAAASGPEGSWLELMQGWWRQATSEERRAFLRWLAEQG
jgi:uncharacterized protein YccT (UPF0319 family)